MTSPPYLRWIDDFQACGTFFLETSALPSTVTYFFHSFKLFKSLSNVIKNWYFFGIINSVWLLFTLSLVIITANKKLSISIVRRPTILMLSFLFAVILLT